MLPLQGIERTITQCRSSDVGNPEFGVLILAEHHDRICCYDATQLIANTTEVHPCSIELSTQACVKK